MSMMETVVLLNSFVETFICFLGFFDEEKALEIHFPAA